MGRLIYKGSKNSTLYMEWSTVVDGPTCFFDDRESVVEWLVQDYVPERPRYAFEVKEADARLDRADETGTSSYMGDGSWGDESVILQRVRELGWPNDYGFALLPRKNFDEFIRRHIDAEDVDKVDLTGLLEPITPED